MLLSLSIVLIPYTEMYTFQELSSQFKNQTEVTCQARPDRYFIGGVVVVAAGIMLRVDSFLP